MKDVTALWLLGLCAVCAACSDGPSEAPVSSETSTGASTGPFLPEHDSTSGADTSGESSGAPGPDTDDDIQPPDVSAPDCDTVFPPPTDLPAVLDVESEVRGLVAHPGGEYTAWQGQSVVQLSSDGIATPLPLEPGLTPTAIAGDGHGNLYVVGTLPVSLSGDVDGFIRRYVGTQLAGHLDLRLEPGTNERPRSVSAAAGHVAVYLDLEPDLLAPNQQITHRIDRLTTTLERLHSAPLYAVSHAVDETGTLFNAESRLLTAWALDGTERWSQTIPEFAAAVAVAEDTVWVLRQNDPGDAALLGFAREDGAPTVQRTLDADPEEDPAALALSPCGGMFVLSTWGPHDALSWVLSHVDHEGTRTDAPLTHTPRPLDLFGNTPPSVLSTAADGHALALLQVPGGHQLVEF